MVGSREQSLGCDRNYLRRYGSCGVRRRGGSAFIYANLASSKLAKHDKAYDSLVNKRLKNAARQLPGTNWETSG